MDKAGVDIDAVDDGFEIRGMFEAAAWVIMAVGEIRC